ncbi:MAG TPA: AAA family ATPase [Minicystis sp.]|nr:AAA family ATPase [Minicystis sp.]
MTLLGRGPLVRAVAGVAEAGGTVLLHGPFGIGKTTVLREVQRTLAPRRRTGFAPRTRELRDVTRALAASYPEVPIDDRTQRRIRSGLRLAVERAPAVLLLDDVADTGKALKGFLRSLRGTGLGVVLVADLAHPRELAGVRALGLSFREVAVPPLHGRTMRRVLADLLEAAAPAGTLRAEHLDALVDAARGNPGVLRALVARLDDARYWSSGRLLVDLLRIDAAIEVAAVALR